MNWLSKKLVLWQIKKYFHLQNQQQIQVQLLGDHSLTCNNLRLRNSVVNTPTSKFHIQQFTINTLSITYSSVRDQPLKLSLDGAKLVVAFNPALVQKSTNPYQNIKQQLAVFFQAIRSKQELKRRGFIAEEFYQLKKMVTEFVIGKISLLIKNVDISIQYIREGEVHSIGFQLGEVNIKQRMVINNQGSGNDEMKQQEIICTLEELSLYLGISSEQDKIQYLAHNRQILRKTKTIKKNYLLEKQKILIYYNLNKNSLTVNLAELNLRINKLLIVELVKMANYLSQNLSDRPLLRPKKGDEKQYDIGGVIRKMREGTFLWWKYTINKILKRVEQKKQFNILSSFKYKLYLFYIIYKFTFGSNSFVDKSIAIYEESKLTNSIMSSYFMVLNRIDIIRNSSEVDDYLIFFINFVCNSKLATDISKKNGLKTVTIQQIKKSRVYYNLKNCSQFIRDFNNKETMSIFFHNDKHIKIQIYENKYDSILLKQGFTLDPHSFYAIKGKYINKFYKKMTEDGIKWDKLILTLQINKIQFSKSKNQIKLGIPSVLLLSEQDSIVLKINNIMLFKESKAIEAESQNIIVSQKNHYIGVSSLFLDLQKSVVTHLLSVKLFISENMTQPMTQQEEFDIFLDENIYNRLPKHPYFYNFSDESFNIEVEKIIIITSIFEQNQYIVFQINKIGYSAPINAEPPRITLEKLTLTRSAVTNISKIKHGKIQKLCIEHQSSILQNNKPFILTSQQYPRKFKTYSYYQSVVDVVVPFILIQLSFHDIYFFQLAMNYWMEIFGSQFFFPKRKSKTQREKKVLEQSKSRLQYFEGLHKFTKSSRMRVKMEGLQIILYGQNVRESSNQILTMLIEGVLYENKVFILKTNTNISIFNIFIENCLGKKVFNQHKLLEILQNNNKKSKQPLIYSAKQDEVSSLIFYGINQNYYAQQKNSKSQSNYLIKIAMINQFKVQKLRKSSDIRALVKPLFLFHSPDFFQILTNSFGVIKTEAKKNFKPVLPILKLSPQTFIQELDHQILQAKSISEKLSFICEIEKINVIALHQSEPIYTFSLLDISIQHQTEAYVSKFKARVQEFYVVDISPNCGLHPIVIKVKPMECLFTKYSSDLLKKKQKKSALLKLNMEEAEIFFLNRKIKELTNFIMSHFENQPQQDNEQQTQKSKQPERKEYPFCYKISFNRPVIVLLRSSLSEEKMVSEIDSLVIANYTEISENNHFNDNISYNKFFSNPSHLDQSQSSFESCLEINQQEIQFHSFVKGEEQEQNNTKSQIIIDLQNFYIYNNSKEFNKPIIFTPEINMNLQNKHLIATIEQMNMVLSQEDYRLIIRITEQNFGEFPVSYPKDSVLTEEKSIGFKSTYRIDKLNMAFRKTHNQQKFGQLLIQKLQGQNILYTNGQKQDIITIDLMGYESCINNNFQKIILPKYIYAKKQDNRKSFSNQKQDIFNFETCAEHFKEDPGEIDTANRFYSAQENYFFEMKTEDQDKQTILGRGNERKQQDQKNLNKIGKWISGMCKKCMCCCKSQDTIDNKSSNKKDSNKNEKKEERNIQEATQKQHLIDLQQSNIENDDEIINFSSKVHPQNQKAQQSKDHRIFMHIIGQKNRQKRMYMLIQHLQIIYQKNQHIMKLIDFLNKPYSEPEKPSYLKEAKFNNYRPFQMLIQIIDTSVFVVRKQNINEQSIELEVKMFYNLQKLGDPNFGPGKKIMGTDLSFRIFFHDKNYGNRVILSDQIRLVHQKQSKIFYHNKLPVKCKQKLFLHGLNMSNVKINIPISILKSIIQFSKSFTTQQKGPQKQELKQEIMIKKESYKENAEKQKQQAKSQKKIQKQIDQKIIPTTTFKKFYIPNIQINIQSKGNNSFITMFIEKTKLRTLILAKSNYEVSDQVINLYLRIDYWNLNIGNYEPFLEKCQFLIHQKALKKGITENKRLKVVTKQQTNSNAYDYHGGLCVNISTSFFHTCKELQLEYELGNSHFQISNQICYDLTKRDNQAYDFMRSKTKSMPNQKNKEQMTKEFPPQLQNFFGKKFVIQDFIEIHKKKKKSQTAKNKFHVPGLKIFLYHSYLEQKTKMKYITYRTPFRIFNIVPFYKMELNFSLNTMLKPEQWSYELDFKQYYAITEDIYNCDYLININAKGSHKKDYPQMMHNLEKGLQGEQQKLAEEEGENMFLSIKYLVHIHSNKNEYHELDKNKLYEHLFNLSNIQKRWIDKRDILIKTNNIILVLINVKSQCEYMKDKKDINGKNLILYDSLTIIISPIIIYNYTTQIFNLTNCKFKNYELLPSKSLELNEFPENILVKDIFIEFSEDTIHRQYHFMDFSIGTKIKSLLLDKMQSVNIKITKETYNTCIAEIYPDWLIINGTQFQYELLYEKKKFTVDKKSMSSIAIEEWKDTKNPNMKIRICEQNADDNYEKVVAEIDAYNVFTLAKVERKTRYNDQDIRQLKAKLKHHGCCNFKSKGFQPSLQSKQADQQAYKCIQLSISVEQSEVCKLTRNLTISYKYWIINNLDIELSIYQFIPQELISINNKEIQQQQNGIEILRLAPKEKNFLYTYDFIPKQFFAKIIQKQQYIYSNLFTSEDLGPSFSLKLKRTADQGILSSNISYHQNFHYIRIDIHQAEYSTMLTFSQIENDKVKFPYYINNRTNYFVKITQNKETFKIKPKTRVPFSWSNLIDNTHQIQVQIQGQTKVYSLKQKFQFEPIIIRGDSMNNKTNRNVASNKLFKRQRCLVKWQNINEQSLLILDIFSKKLHINSHESVTLNLCDAERMFSSFNKLQIYFKNHEVFEFYPSLQTIKQWAELLRNDLNNDIVDKIYFTIESFQNSIIFFLHNLEVTSDNEVKIQQQQFIIQNFYLSIINSNSIKTQQILLINMENIQYILQNRISQIKQTDDDYKIKKKIETIKVRKLKINNQLTNAVNPVILSQIKKSNFPFLQIKNEMQHLILSERQGQSGGEQIEHYKSRIVFLDEAQLMVQAAIFPEILNLKKSFDQIIMQYSYEVEDQKSEQLKKSAKKATKPNRQQIYLDYLQIKPIKMTISVSFSSNINKQFSPKLMSILSFIPSGVENAIIAVDSCIFHHVFLQKSRLTKILKEYYLYEMKKQILYNASSIQILTPFQLVKGLGIGFKSIFYNPFYQFVNTQQIKSLTSNIIEGLITFFIFIITLCFQILNGIFKFISYFTLDTNFRTRRQMFRNQIFKSPVDGFSHGAKYAGRIFKEYFMNFVSWPCQYHSKYPCVGLLLGFILAILNTIPWLFKLIVTIYDFFYVIGLGFISWGYYEQNSMKYRSRPIRTFPHNQLLPYDYLTCKGNEIMRRNLIQQNDNEEISFISHIQSGDQSKYLLLSNYRILYCSHQLTSFKQITLYKISKIIIGPIKIVQRNAALQDLLLIVELTFPDKGKCLCIENNIDSYQIKFKNLKSMKDFLEKLRINLEKERIDFNLQDTSLRNYQRRSLQPEQLII